MTSDPYTLLAEFLQAKRASRFAWGKNDCCLFAADWLVALGKPDLMAEFRGKYSDALGACRLWRTVGGYEAEGARRLEAAGLVNVPPLLAPRGSIAIFPTHKRHGGFGVVECGRVTVLTPSGLSLLPINAGTQTWRIE